MSDRYIGGFVCKKYYWIDIEKINVDSYTAIGYKPRKINQKGKGEYDFET